ncbi:MAG: type I restriction endonuclease subunit R [Streptococcaceae bacterium]|jgi:type I restriction enzyme R subunit|nr:type I restriction endonuclease subunit R [Streptococcaceae bacterium]
MTEHLTQTKPIADFADQGIILASFDAPTHSRRSFQSESELEALFIEGLKRQGYDYLDVHTPDDLLVNLKTQIERLNHLTFSAAEWERFCSSYLLRKNDGIIEKTRKIQEDYIFDFLFDDGHIQNIMILDKQALANNHVQVIHQVTQVGTHTNRYDVSILVNGLPLVHIELKKRGVDMHEAFAQIQRYQHESFDSLNSLYQYVQIFVISNGTFTRYFANTTARNKNNYEFTMTWADFKNHTIHDLEDFTATFFEKRVLLEILTKYCVFDASNALLIMRPYQIAATERILRQINIAHQNKLTGQAAGGFVWHTTGSGKTLTSFKAARLATELPYIDKVLFVVDRKDLDYQTMKEYEKFEAGSVSGSSNTQALKRSLERDDHKIVVTTIQKLNQFMKGNSNHPIYEQQVIFIFDECHRSQFGEAQKNLQRLFKHYAQFGFTGTPIVDANRIDGKTTADIFGRQLHAYTIKDAIRDGKVLKFKVDYQNVKAEYAFAELVPETDNLKNHEKEFLLHPDRISKVVAHIRRVYNQKTHRNEYYDYKKKRLNGFNAMFAVASVDAAKVYYQEFAKQQRDLPDEKKLRVATIYSFAANESPSAIGEIDEEELGADALDQTAKEFLDGAIADYNATFHTNFSTNGNDFQNYYKDLSKRVEDKDVDLLIVVGMFLTGFNAPTLNTLFVDKNLRYHGLIQAFSRTNRILNKQKAFGNIVCFRELKPATDEAIKTFGDEESVNIILEKSFKDYIEGYDDEVTQEKVAGFAQISETILEKFPQVTEIETDADKKEFAELFGEFLKLENKLRNFDEFQDFEKPIDSGLRQDMLSVYLDIREQVKRRENDDANQNAIDFSEVEFQIELLQTDEITLDYILKLIAKKAQEMNDIEVIKNIARREIRSSLEARAKESLVEQFIDESSIDVLKNQDDILEAFKAFSKKKKADEIKHLLENEHLESEAANLVDEAIRRGYLSEHGLELNAIMPATSRRQGARETLKRRIFETIQEIVERYRGIL